MRKLSIIIPAFNEEKTIKSLLQKVLVTELKYGLEKELVIIDDCSTDNTAQYIQEIIKENSGAQISYTRQLKNMGKGASIHEGIKQATGDLIIIQDADLEYDPADYNDLLEPICSNKCDVVYGSRFKGSKPHRVLFFWHSIGNKFLTFISNMFTNLNLSDMETCYKLFRADILKGLNLKERKFGFEPEVTAKISRIPGIRIMEVGIAYYGRTYSEGKKIGWPDGFGAIYCILKYGLLKSK